jgi:hypothetical protein
MTTSHSHGPNFGRKVDGCGRCDELKDGAEPVRWNKRHEVPLSEIAAHDCRQSGCGPVCTAYQW